MNLVVNARFLTQETTGTQRFAMEISKCIKESFPDVKFLAPKNIIQKEIAKVLEVETVGSLTGHLWEQVELPLILKKLGNPYLLNLVNTAPLLYKKKFVTIHDISFLHFPEYVTKKFYYYYKFLIPRIAHNSLHIFTVSNFSKKDISKNLNINEDKITVIYNAVSDKFKPLNLKKENWILSVATLHPLKNIDALVKAFMTLKKKSKYFKDYKLILVGGTNKKNFRMGSIDLNRKDIILTGHISDENKLIKLYNKAKIFVLPSKFESFCIPALEAMACGLPVIVSNIAALPEVCRDAAYYVNPYNTDDIAKGMETVLKNKKLQNILIKKGLERVKSFCWEDSTKKLMKKITSLISKNDIR